MGWTKLLQAKTNFSLFGDLKLDIALTIEAIREENFLFAGDGGWRVVVDNKERVYLLIKLFFR